MLLLIPEVTPKIAASIYPLELVLGCVIAWILGEDRLELQRRTYYLLESKNIINGIFAYKGNLVWTVDFVCLALVQIYVKCRNHALLPRDARTNSSGPLKSLLKQYMSKIILKNVLLAITFFIIDSIFVLTGGSCLNGDVTRSAERCRISGGQWQGGFDISGHFCFLVNISMILWLELSQFRSYMERESVVFPVSKVVNGVLVVSSGVLGIWVLMLMVTAVYYHTVLEKVLGCALGYVCVLVMYWLIPRSRRFNGLLYS